MRPQAVKAFQEAGPTWAKAGLCKPSPGPLTESLLWAKTEEAQSPVLPQRHTGQSSRPLGRAAHAAGVVLSVDSGFRPARLASPRPDRGQRLVSREEDGREEGGFHLGVTQTLRGSRIYCITDIDPAHRKLSQLEAVVRFLTGEDPDLECE